MSARRGETNARSAPLPWLTFGLAGVLVASFAIVELGFRSGVGVARGSLSRAADLVIATPTVEVDPRLLPVVRGVMPSFEGNAIFAFLRDGSRRGATIRARQQELDQLVADGFARLDAHPLRRFAAIPAQPAVLGFAAHPLLHASWTHLLGTVLMLFLAGPVLERRVGRGATAALLGGGALVGAAGFAGIWFAGFQTDTARGLVGLSAGVAALVAAVVVCFRTREIDFLKELAPGAGASLAVPAWLLAVPWLLYETSLWWSVPGAFPLGVDHAPGHVAHVLGALVGVAAGFPLAKRIGELGPASQPRAGGGRPQVYSAERVMQLRARGAEDEAFAMLASEVAKSARNREAVLLYFEMAVDRGEAKKVAPYVLRLIREELRRGARDQAIAHWAMLTNNEPDALLDPTTLVDLLPDIRASKGAAAAAVAVQQATRHDNPGLSTVLAATIARFAEDLDPDVATHAAKRALSANDLPATGRAELEGIVERLREDYQEPLPPPVVTAEVAPDAFYAAQDRSLFGEAAELVETVREVETFPGVHVSEAVPRLLEDDGLEMEVSGRGPARLAYDRIRGVAVAGVRGLAAKPIVLLDLLLDGPEPTTTPLRVVRFRSDCYDPRVLVSVSGAPLDALLGLVAEIVKRARVLPLSEITAANQIAIFESLEEYQLRVLRVAKPSEA